MSKELFCTECLELVIGEEVNKNETFNIRGEYVTVNSSYFKCPHCEELIYDPEDSSANLEKAYNEYRIRKKILMPDEIKAVREKYNLSQRQLAKLLGWGHATISRYESGVLPSKNHNNTLVLLKDPTNLLEILKINKSDLSHNDYQKIREKISGYMEENKGDILTFYLESFLSTEPDEYSGYQRFNIDKLIQMVKFFALKDKNLYKLRLIKFLFYADFLNYKRTTLSISGLQYINLQKGPVPKEYDLVLTLTTRSEEVRKSLVDLGYNNLGEKFEAVGEVDFSLFTDDEITTLEDVYKALSHHNSNSISELSHGEEAWNNTERLETISYKYAKSLLLE